jgi:hypothetical protein
MTKQLVRAIRASASERHCHVQMTSATSYSVEMPPSLVKLDTSHRALVVGEVHVYSGGEKRFILLFFFPSLLFHHLDFHANTLKNTGVSCHSIVM